MLKCTYPPQSPSIEAFFSLHVKQPPARDGNKKDAIPRQPLPNLKMCDKLCRHTTIYKIYELHPRVPSAGLFVYISSLKLQKTYVLHFCCFSSYRTRRKLTLHTTKSLIYEALVACQRRRGLLSSGGAVERRQSTVTHYARPDKGGKRENRASSTYTYGAIKISPNASSGRSSEKWFAGAK